MDAIKTIMTRRSVRKFKSQPIPEDIVEKILHAAMSAPSATNEQPWQFLLIDDKTLLEKITTVHQNALMCKQAPLVILLCVDMNKEKYRDFWVQDMSAATQNILLAARACELGAVWVGIYPNDERVKKFRELFKMPESVTPFAIIPIGYTDVPQEEAPERFDAKKMQERVHKNSW